MHGAGRIATCGLFPLWGWWGAGALGSRDLLPSLGEFFAGRYTCRLGGSPSSLSEVLLAFWDQLLSTVAGEPSSRLAIFLRWRIMARTRDVLMAGRIKKATITCFGLSMAPVRLLRGRYEPIIIIRWRLVHWTVVN